LTFADIDGSQKNLSDGAFAPRFDNSADEVHSAGEVWCAALFEVRAKFIQRLGHVEGNRRILQIVTDAMKVTGINPTFLQARDAIVAVAQANTAGQDSADAQDVWAGFAVRGIGFSARVVSLGSGVGDGSTRVIEAFDLPNVIQTPGFTFGVITGNNNGYPEPGETIRLAIPLTNNTGATVIGVTLSVNGGTAVNFGTLPDLTTVFRQVDYTIPANAPCGGDFTLTFVISSSRGSYSETRTIRVGTPVFNGGSNQNFDGVTAPSLPNGWEKRQEGAYTGGWVTTVSNIAGVNSNALFAPNAAGYGVADVSVLTGIASASAQLRFKLNYNVEETWDGTVLEIKIGDGEYRDITAAGGSFVSGGYNRMIDTQAGHVLSGRQAWTGNSNGYVDTVVNLPASANNQVVGLRFRAAADANTAIVGTFVDNVELTGGTFFSNYVCSAINSSNSARADFDGDGKTDRAVFRAGTWYVLRSQAGFTGQAWGLPSDQIVSGDFDGDGRDDLAVYRAGATSFWYIINSGNGSMSSIPFGTTGDIPITGDFNGDNKDDIGVFRNGAWYIAPSSGGAMITYNFGLAGDKPVVADYDGDNKADVAVTRGGTWYVFASTGGFRAVQFGQTGDLAVPADYDGDNKDDIAVFRLGIWYVLRSSDNQFQAAAFGLAGDIPVPGDYDGDRKEDIAVYRGGNWYVLSSSSGFNAVQFGLGGDTAITSVFTKTM
ncbi:MAG TPA: M36 family metallopeptidase, partial [Pyrinomonadaceae bacterium]